MVEKSLDAKLARIKADPGCRDFILADAKDADMAYGIAAPGRSPEMHGLEGRFRSLAEYRECIRQVTRQGLVDIMLMSAHTNAILTIGEGLFEGSRVTPAARANDTTDIHLARGSMYALQPSCPFRTATIDHVQCGHIDCRPEERGRGANLGLYSVTFNNDVELDRRTLEAYQAFRLEAERKGFRHFLEVFDPNAPARPIDPAKLGAFMNDMIVRSLAGVPDTGRPLFLKVVYHGPKFMEELVHYDPALVAGVLGGSSGTTYDAFKLLAEAQKHGARVALYGRKINNAEHQLAFVEMLRRIVNGELAPEEAVQAYHGVLQGLGIKPYRPLAEDMQLTDPALAYLRATGGGKHRGPAKMREGKSSESPGTAATAAARPSAVPRKTTAPDFAKMTSAERLAYHRRRLSGTGGA